MVLASESRMPTFTFFLLGALSLSRTMTVLIPSGDVSRAAWGITTAWATVSATMETRTLVPGRRLPFGLGACTQTSTVVLLGSTAGLTRVTLPFTWVAWPGTVIVAGSPAFKLA